MKFFSTSKADAVMLSLLICVSLALAFLAYSTGGVDFGVYYAAGRVTLQGGNPYDYQELASQIVTDTGELNNPYYYAPWFTWATLPLSLLPYQPARLTWLVINFILWFVCLHTMKQIVDWPLAGWRTWGMYLLVTFVFAWSTWGFEQVGILVFFLFIMFLLSASHQKWALAGVWMALLLFKPNVTALPVACVAMWLILRGNWKPVIVMVSLLTLMILISLLISPGWYEALLQDDKLTGLSYTLNTSGGTEVIRYNTTLLDWLSMYGLTGSTATIIYAFVILAGIVAAIFLAFRSDSITQTVALAVLVNFAVIPYALFYDYPVLTLTLFYLNSQVSGSRWMRLVQSAVNTIILFSLFIGDKISYRYWIIIVLIVFGLTVYFNDLRFFLHQRAVKGAVNRS